MTKLLFVPALLLAACTEVLPVDQAPTGADDESVDESADISETAETPEVALTVGFTVRMENCSGHNVWLAAQASYPDGTVVENPICQFTLEDGTTLDGCVAVPALPTAQNVVLTVTDPATGATGTYEQVVIGPGSFDATLEAHASDHAIHWNITSNYDGMMAAGDVITASAAFDPNDERVLLPDPKRVTTSSGVVSVSEVGTYQIVLQTGIHFASGGGCAHRIETTVTVFCDGSAHE